MHVLVRLADIQGVEPPGHLADPPVGELFAGPRVMNQAIGGVVTGTAGGVPLVRLPVGGLGAGVALLRADPPRPGVPLALPWGAFALSAGGGCSCASAVSYTFASAGLNRAPVSSAGALWCHRCRSSARLRHAA
jgi:hypothetical protein